MFETAPNQSESLLLGIPMTDKLFDYSGEFCDPVGRALEAAKVGRIYGTDVHALDGKEPYRACLITTTDRHRALDIMSRELAGAKAPRGVFIRMLGPIKNPVMKF